MKLYQIDCSHHASRDAHISILGYLIAENDEQVYDFIASNGVVNGNNIYCSWKEQEKDDPEEAYDEKHDVIVKETHKEKMLRLKGELEDDSIDFSDSYYGITLYGWTDIGDISEGDIETLIRLGIAKKINQN